MSFKPISIAKEGDTTFCNLTDPQQAYEKYLWKCKASKIHVYPNVASYVPDSESWVEMVTDEDIRKRLFPSDNPKLAFIKEFTKSEEHNHSEDIIRSQVEIGNSCMIGEGVQITHTTIGNDCIIYPNCTLGFPALAMERDVDNTLYDFKHIGRLEIGNNVRIGQLTNIARGTLATTIVEDNVRTDAHVNVAHNCHIKKGAILAVGCVLGGSVTVEEDCWIGMNATLREHVTIGHNALVGMGAVVLDDVKPNDIVAGCPAESIKHKVTLSDASRFMMVGAQERGQY